MRGQMYFEPCRESLLLMGVKWACATSLSLFFFPFFHSFFIPFSIFVHSFSIFFHYYFFH